MRSQPYSNKGMKNTLRVATSFLRVHYFFIFFAPFKAFVGGGGEINFRLRGFQRLFLEFSGGHTKTDIKVLKKVYFRHFSVRWGLNPIFTNFRGEVKTLVIINNLLGGTLLILIAELKKAEFRVTDILAFIQKWRYKHVSVILQIADSQALRND